MKNDVMAVVRRFVAPVVVLVVLALISGAQDRKASLSKAGGHAPVVTDLKIIETAPDPAQVYFRFKISDVDGDLDLLAGHPIKAGVFCGMAGFAGDSFGKADKYDKQSGVVHYRATYAPHRGAGECSFNLTVKDKAGNESTPVEAKVVFK